MRESASGEGGGNLKSYFAPVARSSDYRLWGGEKLLRLDL